MIYYPLTTLMDCGVREFCLISTMRDLPRFEELLGNGHQWGIDIQYRVQLRPDGIAQAFRIAEPFIGCDPVALVLGDNIFCGIESVKSAVQGFKSGATIFGYQVQDPQRYGVVQFDKSGKALSIEEKPTKPLSNYAVPGLYFYDNQVIEMAWDLKPSQRGELEITDINMEYLKLGALHVKQLDRGFVWLDAGTTTSLYEASAYVQTIEKRQGIKIGCPEEAALRRGFINPTEFNKLTASMPLCEYRSYLERVATLWV